MKIIASIIALFVTVVANGQCGSNRVFIGTGIGYSAYSEFSFGIEAGLVPALSKVYFTAGGIAYTAKKDLNEKWKISENGQNQCTNCIMMSKLMMMMKAGKKCTMKKDSGLHLKEWLMAMIVMMA